MALVCGEKKRPGGKLVRVCVRLEESHVKGVLLTGDYFAEPEEAYEELILELKTLEGSPQSVLVSLPAVIAKHGVSIYGAEVEDIVEALRRALESSGILRGEG